jgi:putative chitinase
VAFSFALNIAIMNILELDSYNLGDAVKFNDQLNPRIWQGNKMRPEVRAKLLEIAEDFKQSLGLTDLNVKDITLSGSNAGYTYTPHSDIDLHLVVDLPQADVSDVYRELFDAKKFQYNETHNIKIGGYDVELYVENANKSAVSQGIFSVVNDDWIKIPLKKRSTINDNVVKNKYDVIKNHIESAIESADLERLTNTAAKIKKMRQSGLDRNGELGPENLAYKMLRSQGVIKKLYDARTAAKDHELSLRERTIQVKQPFRYGFKTTTDEDVSANPSGVSPETKMFLSEKPALSQQEIVTDFVNYCVEQLGIEQQPTIKFKRDPEWSARNKTFGRFNHETNLLEVSLAGRHVMDILRTVAHELTHQRQHEVGNVPDTAGETGSEWENEANARAGVLMREYAQQHPEYFADESLEESSGYIPTKKQANDPRFKMALTPDVRPGATGREANKMALKTDSQGRPALLMKTANQMHEELANDLRWEFALMETEILGEINMSTGSLRREAAKTGAIAGMEFEMIVPNVEGGNDDLDMEPDYGYDERVNSIQDAYDFFYDGDYNSRGDVSRLRDKMQNEYYEWLNESFDTRWDGDESEFVYNYIKENASADEIAEILGTEPGDYGEYPDPDKQAYLDATDKVIEEGYGNYWYDQARESAQEDFNNNADQEAEWLEDRDLNTMQDISTEYDISWPHWTNVSGGGEASIEDIAQEFENAIDRPVQASGNYHSGSVRRPSPTAQHYVVEPDGSLEADDSNDVGLEFVSPPLPIDDILSDLNKVKQWAKVYGCYTNDSTGLHINISVPNYSRENLDFVKLALLMGDEYVLDLFGRAGNTYAKPAIKMVRDQVRQKPDEAERLLDKMKGNLDSLASKAIHSGVTSKYTSINTKDGHIEFRSPGGDWLDQNFDQIENTLLRFTVAMSAALDPDMYREEYLKKLYKLLTQDDKGSDTIRYFSEYVAGKIPAAALRSFVKQAQLERKLKKDPTGGEKYWWSVGRPGYGASVEVVATSKEEAIEKGRAEYPDWATAKDMTAKPVRPYKEQSAKTVRYEIYNKQTGNSVEDANGITNDADALVRLNDYIEHGPHALQRGQATAMFGIRTTNGVEIVDIDIPMAPGRAQTSPTGRWKIIDGLGRELFVFFAVNNTRAFANEFAAMWAREYNFDGNYQVEPADDTTTPVAGSTSDLARQRAVPGTFTGAWKIIDADGNEMHRFSGIGNNQRDANRVATQWVQNNGYAYGTEIEVVPVMSDDELEEGLKSTLAGLAAAGAMAFTPAPTNTTAPTAGTAVQPAAVQQSPTAAAESTLSRIAQAAGIKGVELAQFLAQCAHETGNFLHLEELGGNRYLAQYDPTVNPAKAKALGNTEAGDGAKYKGRGFIQITGKANYAKAGQALGIDLVNSPELAARPDVAAKIAVWYWQSRVQPRVQDFADTKLVTKQINPGLKGLADRQSNFKDYQQQVAAVAQPKATV